MTVIEVTPKELKDSCFHDSVAKYLEIENLVRKHFILGLVKLGCFLAEQKDIYKPKGLWMDYLKAIKKNYGASYQLIKLYEYSQNNLKTLLLAEITTWGKLYTFLSLPDALREDFVEKLQEIEADGADYKELVDEDITVGEEDVTVDNLEECEEHEKLTLDNLLANSIMKDSPFMAKELVKQFKSIGYSELTENSIAFAEGYVDLVKCLKNLNKPNYKSLSSGEKKFWRQVLKGLKNDFVELERFIG